MHTFAISEDTKDRFRAVSGRHQSVGKTMGEALDTLNAQMDEEESGALVLIQKRVPDRFFTAAQQERLEDLRSRRNTLTAEEYAEWENLVNAELDATVARTNDLFGRSGHYFTFGKEAK